VSPSALKGIHKFTITVKTTEDVVSKVVKQIDKRVDILKAYYNTDEDLVFQEIALYKVATDKLLEMGSVEDLIRKYHIRILEMNSDFVVLQKAGHYAETQQMFEELSETVGVLQFIRSGRVAITRSKVERLSDMLDNIQKTYEKNNLV
jgi:acetolactate synthase-1/3 small subunit